MLIDHVSNLPSSLESVVFLSTLLFETCSFSEVDMREKLFQGRRNHRIKHIKIGEATSRELKAKAAESSTLLFFAIDVIEKHKARMLNPAPLLEAGASSDCSPRPLDRLVPLCLARS